MRKMPRPDKVRRVPFFLKLIIILLVLAGIFYGAMYYVSTHYLIKEVMVDGNVHYSDDEIKDIVMAGRFGNNSLYLSYKYKNKDVESIPFVETINVQIVSSDTIRISVYEKALAGYIEYLGRYIYFDKDGIVVESSGVKTTGIPEVVGIDLDYVVLYEKLPADNPELFKNVLNITQLMTKYGVLADRMYFKSNGELVLYEGNVTVNLGKDEDMDIKIMNLPSLLAKLNGTSGTLRMENYNETTKKVSFEPN